MGDAKHMRAAVVNPYLDSLGGGERYTLAVCEALVDAGYTVDIEWNDQGIKEKLVSRFGISMKGISIVDDVKRGDGYHVCFWVSDGSIPLMHAQKNILHFQVPFTGVNGKSLMNRMKLFRIKHVVCNSNFTKYFVDREYGVHSVVVHPPVDTTLFTPKKKENMILYVGRFSKLLQNKRHDVLIECFKELYNKGYKMYRLVLAGGSDVGLDSTIEALRHSAKGYPIEFMLSPDVKTLKDMYGKARFFWSASGCGVDGNVNPQKVEHFGITLVESMAAGCVPFAYKNGGHVEIIDDSVNGYLWSRKQELITKTIINIEDKNKREAIAKCAIARSKDFSYDHFKKEFIQLL